jgi:anaerobic selenocysteine-containing dehydrogenase
LQRFRLAARGHGPVQPPDSRRERIATYFDPLPFWYPPTGSALDGEAHPLHAVTQRPMHMYHSWGSQNAWLRQITARNRVFVHPETAAAAGVGDDDWVWIVSSHGRVKGQVRLMTGVEKDTVWTWNAIGKRRRAWGLARNAPEATQGFLLNHVIADLLPEQADGMRYANADPVTGQAAWYDLRVRIERCAAREFGETDPQFADLAAHGDDDVPVLRYGSEFRQAPSGKTGGRHREWVGNREAHAAAATGVRAGHGNRVVDGEDGEP